MTAPKPGHAAYELTALLDRLSWRADCLCIRPGSIAAAQALAEKGYVDLRDHTDGVVAMRNARTPDPRKVAA